MIEVNQNSFMAGSTVRQGFPNLVSATYVPARYRPGNQGTWSGHLPFARDLVESLRPRLLVELGTHYGESYFGFCQSVAEIGLSTTCYAIDTWLGDPHAGQYGDEVFAEVDHYNRERYASFSYLLRTTFDDALAKFSDESIDLLHIDGLHTFEAVKHDWENWFPKVAPGGIVLLHDIAPRHVDFGVWKLWEEISPNHTSYEFHHYYGLGVIQRSGLARQTSGGILDYLFDPENADSIRRYYVLCSQRLDAMTDLAAAKAAKELGSQPIFQIFYPQAGVYSEQASVRCPITPGAWQRLTFELPGLESGFLRLDPADCAAVIDIGSVAFFSAFDGKELWKCVPRGEPRHCFQAQGTAWLVPHEIYLEVFSYGTDPQIRLAVPDCVPRGEPLIFECWALLHQDFAVLAERAEQWVGQIEAQREIVAVVAAEPSNATPPGR